MKTITAEYPPNISEKFDSTLIHIATVILLSKAAFFILIFFAYHTLPYSESTLRANFTYQTESHQFSSAFKTWDGHHYHSISESGYLSNHLSSAFYPLYPATINLFKPLSDDDAVKAGLLASNIASFFAYLLLYLFFKKETNTQTAMWGIFIMLGFPVAFYTNILYSEAIFLLLAAGLFWGTAYRSWGITFIAAFLLPLTRPQGLLLAFPYAIYVWHANQWRIKPTLLSPSSITAIFFGLGLALYLSIIYWETGNPLEGFHAQKHFVAGNSLSNILDIRAWLDKNFIAAELTIHGFTNSWIDRGFFFFYIFSLGLISINLKNKGFLVCALILGLLPALSGSFMSYARYTLIIFPIFFALSATLKDKSIYFITFCIPLQTLFAVRHCLNYWQG